MCDVAGVAWQCLAAATWRSEDGKEHFLDTFNFRGTIEAASRDPPVVERWFVSIVALSLRKTWGKSQHCSRYIVSISLAYGVRFHE
mmetsp:Transcript_15626/g.39281  ORF Transcript_15626/g.39281 Transcript_15626/m.39281 type:complete len:86 (-) Transcript_15626:39-296(-)